MIANPDIQIQCVTQGPREYVEMSDPSGGKSYQVLTSRPHVTLELTDLSDWWYQPLDAFHLSDKMCMIIHSAEWYCGHWTLSGELCG